MTDHELMSLCEGISLELQDELRQNIGTLLRLYRDHEGVDSDDPQAMLFFAIRESQKYTEKFIYRVLSQFAEPANP